MARYHGEPSDRELVRVAARGFGDPFKLGRQCAF
jgi:hypothetical protein